MAQSSSTIWEKLWGNNDHRTAQLESIETNLNLLDGYGIEAGGGLIREDDWWIFEEEPGNGNTLLLPARKLLDIGAVLLGQAHNLLVQIRFGGRPLHLFQAGSYEAIAVGQNAPHGILQQHTGDTNPNFLTKKLLPKV